MSIIFAEKTASVIGKKESEQEKPKEKRRYKSVEHTFGKRKVVTGIKEYIDPDTGSVEPIITITRQGVDINFHKMWVENLFLALGIYGGTKMTIFLTIMRYADKNNIVHLTQQEIADESNTTQKTVALCIGQLDELGVIRKIKNGRYMINPDMIFRGPTPQRLKIMQEYGNERAYADRTDSSSMRKEL